MALYMANVLLGTDKVRIEVINDQVTIRLNRENNALRGYIDTSEVKFVSMFNGHLQDYKFKRFQTREEKINKLGIDATTESV